MENLTGGTPPVRYLLCVVPCKLYFDAGEITGIKARTRATVDSLRWDLQSKTAQVTVTSDIDQTITVSCGLSDKTETLTFRAGETKTVDFVLN